MNQFHIMQFGPCDNWPKGGYSVYKITGDEIADRVVKDANGEITERYPWCGYLGIIVGLEGLAALVGEEE